MPAWPGRCGRMRPRGARPLRADAARARRYRRRTGERLGRPRTRSRRQVRRAAGRDRRAAASARHRVQTLPDQGGAYPGAITARVQDLVADARARALLPTLGPPSSSLAGIAAESAAKRAAGSDLIARSLRKTWTPRSTCVAARPAGGGGPRRRPDTGPIVLFKGLLASLADISDPAQRDLVFASWPTGSDPRAILPRRLAADGRRAFGAWRTHAPYTAP